MPGGEKSLELIHKGLESNSFSCWYHIFSIRIHSHSQSEQTNRRGTSQNKLSAVWLWRRNLLVTSQSLTAGELESHTSPRRSPYKNKSHSCKNCPKPWNVWDPCPKGIGIYSATNDTLVNKTSMAKHHISNSNVWISLNAVTAFNRKVRETDFQTSPVVWNVQDKGRIKLPTGTMTPQQ